MDSSHIIILNVLLGLIFLSLSPIFIFYFLSWRAGYPIGLFRIVGMILRRVPTHKVIPAYLFLRKAGVNVSVSEVEFHTMSGGDLRRVCRYLKSLGAGGSSMNWDNVCLVDFLMQEQVEGWSRL